MGAKAAKKGAPRAKGALHMPKTVFDKKAFTTEMLEAAADAVVRDLTSCVLHMEEEGDGTLLFKEGEEGGIYEEKLRFREKLGEGSFGSVYALGGEASNVVVKLVKFVPNYNGEKITFQDWLVKVAAEAILLKVFSESGTGPRVPTHSVAFAPDLKTAFLFMERADGSLFDFWVALKKKGSLRKWQSFIESEVRKRTAEAIKVGMLCTDTKPENMLYNIRGGKYHIVLSDFDSTFCCSEAESLAREKLSNLHIELPTIESTRAFLAPALEKVTVMAVPGMPVDMDPLPPVLSETGAACPKKKADNDKLIYTLNLAMLGGAMGMLDKEFDKAVKFIENRNNIEHPVHRAFVVRWVHYNSYFLPGYRRPYDFTTFAKYMER